MQRTPRTTGARLGSAISLVFLSVLFSAAAGAQTQANTGATSDRAGASGRHQSSGASGTSPSTTQSGAPVAGATPLGITVVEMQNVITGWSAKRTLIDKSVLNDRKEKIGKVDDIIVRPAGSGESAPNAYAIVGVGGFLGVGKHDVVIPMTQLRMQGDQIVLAGATKDTLKALPAFEYARK